MFSRENGCPFDMMCMWHYLIWLENRPRHHRLPFEFSGGELLPSWRECLQLNREDPRALALFCHVLYIMSFNAGYLYRASKSK